MFLLYQIFYNIDNEIFMMLSSTLIKGYITVNQFLDEAQASALLPVSLLSIKSDKL